jgi:DNA-directed RNA polymerase beta' subunit
MSHADPNGELPELSQQDIPDTIPIHANRPSWMMGKEGLVRGNIMGMRINNATRQVITPTIFVRFRK